MYQLVRERELSSRCTERHCRAVLSSNAACVQRMELQQTLQGHAGCVNTVSFDTEAGSTLISGSDDLNITLWDWETGAQRLSFFSDHSNNVFQARMLPHTAGSKIVTCAADGQVRLCQLPEGASSSSVVKSLLGQHHSRAHKLALDPLCPAHCFYSCGEDGLVVHYDLRCGAGASEQPSGSAQQQQQPGRTGARRKLVACRGYSRSRGHTREVVGLNAIHVNPLLPWHFAVGAADPWARVYDVRRTAAESAGDTVGPATREQSQRLSLRSSSSRNTSLPDEPVALLCPRHLASGASPGDLIGDPHITCVSYSKQGELLASYNDEDVYLFSAQASRGGLNSSSSSRPAGLSPSRRPRGSDAPPGSQAAAAAAAGGSGVRYAHDEEDEDRPRWRRRQRLVTTGEAAAAGQAEAAAGGTGSADGSAPAAVDTALHPAPGSTAGAAAAAGSAGAPAAPAADSSGPRLPRGLHGYEPVMGAVLYDAASSSRDGVVASYYGHRNAATVKGVSFFGEDDEYVLSGSDCGHVFMWDKARGTVVWWQEADSEVVNCLEPHPRLPLLLATSGIEHDVKLFGCAATTTTATFAPASVPPAAALTRAMAANQRARQATRQAYSEPEQWLLQLLAAQRRRTIAARRRQAAAAAAPAAGAAGPGLQQQEEEQQQAADEEDEPLVLPPGGIRVVWGAGQGGRRRGGRQQRQGDEGEDAGSEDEAALSSSSSEGEGVDDDDDESDGQPCHIS